MEIQSFKAEYEKLAKKYKLPSFSELDNDFELLYVGNLLEASFPLRFVRRRLADKLAIYCNMFQSLMQPNPSSPISLQESKFFNEVQLKRMVEILKQLMYFERASFYLDTSPSEAEDAAFIKETVEAWKKYKKELTEFATIIKDTWKKEVKEVKENKNQYFG